MPIPEYPGANPFPSPNFDERPVPAPDAIVLHATTGPALPSLQHLANPGSGVSIHYLIDRDGTVYQQVEEIMRAWHAGPSDFQGRQRWNDFSIGIELVNLNNGDDPYEPALVEATRNLCVYLVNKYAIAPNMIATHAKISGRITGKSDPRGFPLEEFIMSLTSAAMAIAIPDEVKMAAWRAIGINYNPVAAFQKIAAEMGMGRPVSNEGRVTVGTVVWAFQGFDGGILATEEGNWGNIRKVNWL